MKDYYEKTFSNGFNGANSKSNLTSNPNGGGPGRQNGVQTNDMFIPGQSQVSVPGKKSKAHQQSIQM